MHHLHTFCPYLSRSLPALQPSPVGGEHSLSHPRSLSVAHVTVPAPLPHNNCVGVEGRAALGCCHCHHQGLGHCPCGTHLLSQFPIWDRDTAPSTVPCLCLCRLFGNMFFQIPSLSLLCSTGRLVGGSSAPARLETPWEEGCALLHGS